MDFSSATPLRYAGCLWLFLGWDWCGFGYAETRYARFNFVEACGFQAAICSLIKSIKLRTVAFMYWRLA